MAYSSDKSTKRTQADDLDDWFYGNCASKKVKEETLDDSFDTDGVSTSRQVAVTVKKDSLLDMSLGCLQIFPKQRLAAEFLQSNKAVYRNLRIFSYELSEKSEGQRFYLVTTLPRFWKWYESEKEKHVYELIYEDFPCRLYFDLEYSKESNPNIDQNLVYDHFCDVAKQLLQKHFAISINPKKNFLVLDSSSEKKFSAHVICHFDDQRLFPGSAALKSFTNILREELIANDKFGLLDSTGTKPTTLFDPAVYTKNRNFRLYLSSKLGSTRVLRRADYCSFYDATPSDKDLFYDSLCVPANFENFKTISMDTFQAQDQVTRNVRNSSKCETLTESSPKTPYTPLDDFMLGIWRRWNPSVYIRQWKIAEVEGVPETLTYYPANCRFCFNIDREHKSNGTFWVVNLKKGHFEQKCFDYECRGFSSNLFPLPKHLQAYLNKEISNKKEKDDSFESNLLDGSIEMPPEAEYFTKWNEIFDS